MMNENAYSLSDIAAASGGNRGGAWGGDFSSWIIIFLIFAMFGWGGRGGYGGYGGSDGGIQTNYVLTSDFAQVERKLDGIANGICDSTYALNNTATNGFAAAQQTMTQGFAGLNTGMVQQGYETRMGIQNLGTQMGQCCCDLRAGIADLKYANAQGFNGIGQSVNMAARDIIDNANANYRALHDEIVANRLEDKNAQIAALQQQVFSQQLAASQAAQNNFLVDKLGQKCPIPAYITCNPFAPVQQTNGCGCA